MKRRAKQYKENPPHAPPSLGDVAWFLKERFDGCVCRGQIRHDDGSVTEVYSLPGEKSSVGIWLQDGAIMACPVQWLERYRESGAYTEEPPEEPKNILWQQHEAARPSRRRVLLLRRGSGKR